MRNIALRERTTVAPDDNKEDNNDNDSGTVNGTVNNEQKTTSQGQRQRQLGCRAKPGHEVRDEPAPRATESANQK